jgi:hypothetical protein
MPEDEVSKEEIEKEKRRIKKLLPPEKRIEEHKALQKSKKLEKEHVPSSEEELEEMEEFSEEAESARDLLKPAWYLKKYSKKSKKNK